MEEEEGMDGDGGICGGGVGVDVDDQPGD